MRAKFLIKEPSLFLSFLGAAEGRVQILQPCTHKVLFDSLLNCSSLVQISSIKSIKATLRFFE